MSNLLLIVSAIGVAAMLIALNYGSMSEFAKYHAVAGTRPAYEPYVIEPLVNSSGIIIRPPNVFGYDEAIHHPEDDSVTLVFDDRDYPDRHKYSPWPSCRGEATATGKIYTQTYHVGQTFAYCCHDYAGDFYDHNSVSLYQYRGTNVLQGAQSYEFVHFEVNVPEDFTCDFPDYLENSIDIYDAGWFDDEYDLGGYGGPIKGASANYTAYVEPIKHAVLITPAFVDPIHIEHIRGGNMIREIKYDPDGTLAVIHQQLVEANGTRAWSGPEYARTYEPGQTFLAACVQEGHVTVILVYDYRGAVLTEKGPIIYLVNFNAYTRVPIPCEMPGILDHSVDAFDTSGFDLERHAFDRLDALYG